MIILIKCPTCQKEISSMAKACPSCGHPLEETEEIKEKKIPVKQNINVSGKQSFLILFIITIIIIVYVSYNANNSASFQTNTSQEALSPIVTQASNAQKIKVKAFLKPGYSLSHIYAIKSKDFKRVHFIAGRIRGNEVTGNTKIGVWAISGTVNEPGITMSVNPWAIRFSVAPNSAKSKAKITMDDDGAGDVYKHVVFLFLK